MAELVIKLVNGELAGKTAQEIAKQIRDAGTAARKAEVGTQAWVDAHKKLEKAKGIQEDLRKQVEATTGASNMLKKAWLQLPGAQFFTDVAGSIGGMKTAVGGLTSGMKILKFAIQATGLGLLVVLLGSLVVWFTKTERGGDLLAKIMAGLGAAVNVVIDRVSKLIDALYAFVTGNWSEAAKKFGEATSNVTKEIVEETKAAWELADALDKLEELEDKLILIRSRTKQQVSELRLLAKDETKSLAERSAALEKAIGLTRALNQQELEAKEGRVLQALQVKDLNELQQKYGVTLDELLARGEDIITVDNLGLGESMQGDLKGAFEALAAYNETIASSADAERTIITELNTLRKKARGEDAKDQAAASKEKEESLKKEREAQEDEYAAMANIRKLEAEKRLAEIEDAKERELEALNLATEEKITALQGSEAQILEQIKLLREIQGTEVAVIEQKWADKKAEDEKLAREKMRQDALAQLDLDLTMDQNILNERYLAQQINEQQFRALSAQNVLTHKQEELEILKAAHGEQSAEYQRAYADYLALQTSAADASVEITEKMNADRMAALQGGLTVFGNVFGQMAGMYEQGTEQWKNMAVAQAVISTIQGSINAFTSALQVPFIGGVLAPIAAAAALAAGMANVQKIKNTKVQAAPKKELGGYLDGPRHSDGGIPIEAEGGEFIFSRRAVKAIGVRELNRINSFYTRKFAVGGPVNPYTDRASVPSGATRTAEPMSMSENAELIAEVRALRAEVSAWPQRLRVINVVTDTEEGIKTINRIKDDASV